MLPPRRGWECRLQEVAAGGEAWAGLPQRRLPCARATSPSLWVPMPQGGEAAPVPVAVAGWAGGRSPPAHLYVCGWEGGGPAPNYIKNISMLWLSLLWCRDFACPLALGKNPREGL